MAIEQTAKDYRDALETIQEVDREKLFREKFQEQPIYRLQEELDSAVTLAAAVEPIVDELPESFLRDHLYGHLNLIRIQVVHLVNLNDDSYYNQAVDRAEELRRALEQFYPIVTSAAAVLIVRSGILDRQLPDEAVLLDSIRRAADKTFGDFENELEIAKDEAVAAAQKAATEGWANSIAKDFEEEKSHHNRRSLGWGIGAVILLGSLVAYVWVLIAKGPPKDVEWWQALYLLALRLTALGALAAGAGFALKSCRAHIHMAETNRHRWKLSRNIPNFMLSASKEARDEVLRSLIEVISSFGSSGLLGSTDEPILPTRQVIEQVSKFQPGGGG